METHTANNCISSCICWRSPPSKSIGNRKFRWLYNKLDDFKLFFISSC